MILEATTPDTGRRFKTQELDLTEVHHPNCPHGRMSVRQRRRTQEAATPQIPSEMNKAVEAVRFVSAHLKNEGDFKEVLDNLDCQNTSRSEKKTEPLYFFLISSLVAHRSKQFWQAAAEGNMSQSCTKMAKI